MIYAAILAGGTGQRMGSDLPKQFLEIGGKPVIVHTVERFAACKEFEKLIVMTPAEWTGYTEELLAGYFHDMSRIIVAAGGDTRNETLMNAIAVIERQGKRKAEWQGDQRDSDPERNEECSGLDDGTVIVTHDAVRPFVTQRMICENIESAMRTGACETAFPATDTIIRTEDGVTVAEVPDRSELMQTQTPQSFKAKKLKELYMSLTPEEKDILTDAAKIFVIKGEPVEIVRGESYNIKITYPYDIAVAEAIISVLE